MLPVLIVALSVPLILGKAPPNSAYGFKTPKTLASSDIWYPANRAAGWFLLAPGVMAVCFNLGLWWVSPGWPPDRVMWWMTGGTLIPVAMSTVLSFIYLGRL